MIHKKATGSTRLNLYLIVDLVPYRKKVFDMKLQQTNKNIEHIFFPNSYFIS